ncbi:MAG: phage head morphogenesis protein, partial [Candidatus Adiutrix sp.]|nr:phage head morphogenesis protein [Candidatus Adiutrix sp.]
RQISKWRAQKKGLKIETEMPSNLIHTGPGGYRMPVAAPGADKGFVGNVGRDWLEGLSPSELSEALTFGEPRTVCPLSGNFADSAGACGLPLKDIDPRHIRPIQPGDILPRGQSEEFYALEFLKLFGLGSLDGSKVISLKGVNLPLVISKGFLQDRRQEGEWVLKANKAGRGPYLPLMAKTILDPFEIWRTQAVRPNGKIIQSLNLIRLFGQADEPSEQIGGFAVFRLLIGPNAYFWNGSSAFPPQRGRSRESILKYLERQRQGNLIYREE